MLIANRLTESTFLNIILKIIDFFLHYTQASKQSLRSTSYSTSSSIFLFCKDFFSLYSEQSDKIFSFNIAEYKFVLCLCEIHVVVSENVCIASKVEFGKIKLSINAVLICYPFIRICVIR